MSKRQRRQREKQRRHQQRHSPGRHQITIGAGVALSATLGMAGTAHATDFTVNSTLDNGNGTCNDGSCTLRDAIDDSSANNTGPDNVLFQSGLSGTITLGSDMTLIDEPVDILGPGPSQITVDGVDSNRLFFINTASGADVAISGLNLTNGQYTGYPAGPDGGAIHSTSADLTLSNVVLSSSYVDGAGDGGAIGVNGYSGSLTVQSSSLIDNHAFNYNDGGAIFSYTPVTIQSSTIAFNSTDGSGGGINGGGTIQNSTIYSNSAYDDGGGLFGTWTIQSSTFSQNGGADGGGIYSLGTTTLENTIVADNQAGVDPDVSGTFDTAFSLIEDTSGETVTETVPGANITGVDPQLGPLASNGGPTQTQALPQTSPALDKGSATGTDQRGLPRPSDFLTVANSAAAGANGADIGAFELQAPALSGGGGTTQPSNQFSFGGLKRNLKKGTAKLTVQVPGPGILTLKGKGLVKQRPGAARALASKVVSAAGKVKLLIKAKGKKKATLNETGKVKVKAKITYTPTGGTSNSKTKKVKLKKAL